MNGMDMKYVEEEESTGFNGLEHVEAQGKGNIFSLGNQTEGEGDYGILEKKGVVDAMAWQPSKDILRNIDFIL